MDVISLEYEADYIGMMLMASAGYHPRYAQIAYEKLAIQDESDLFSTHPTFVKRIKALSDANVMGKALALYLEALNHKSS
ncbi:hypothetical protein QJS04_geneDACA023418 [Acorus gramineus]|uniref:Peptidase M48 domain-containing protein n=1 Tax=Acorus gramineus TaxID=55184 RepID=A0AAV9ACA2_ACOGR|nr:hypothetical protein QJS04_geneDACA023706 [Acorus gramineus]KAK1261746.1 hypothetical protein QJS04_geneDACA023418 [Acorus gramineus]